MKEGAILTHDSLETNDTGFLETGEAEEKLTPDLLSSCCRILDMIYAYNFTSTVLSENLSNSTSHKTIKYGRKEQLLYT